MRNLRTLDHYRLQLKGFSGDETCGMFKIPSRQDGCLLRIIAAAGMDWDHVSVSLQNRLPSWDDMEQVKRLFFGLSGRFG